MKVKRISVGSLIIGTVVLVLLSGCAIRFYDAPRAICGVSADPDSLEPLLPSGRELHQSKESVLAAPHGCEVLVDGLVVMWANYGSVDRIYDPITEAEGFTGDNPVYMRKAPFTGKASVSDDVMVAMTPCGAPRMPNINVQISVDESVNDDVAERRDELERFSRDYVPELKKKLKCKA